MHNGRSSPPGTATGGGLCQQAEVLDVEPTYSGECEDQSLQKDRMSTNDTIEVTSFNMSDLEKIKSEAKHGRATMALRYAGWVKADGIWATRRPAIQ